MADAKSERNQPFYFTMMNQLFTRSLSITAACAAVLVAHPAIGAPEKNQPAAPALPETDISFRNEVQRAIEKGLDSLKQSQQPDGVWSTPDHPAITALALTAFQGEPTGRYRNTAAVKKGYDFILSCVKPDGGIYQRETANYDTCISMMALLAAKNPAYDPILRKARQFVASAQVDLGEKGKLDTPFDGGVGYGSKYHHSDLNNTLVALEAMYYSKHLARDQGDATAQDLNWQAAIHFVQKCQNLPAKNQEAWISDQPGDNGGFFYYPGKSMAGEITNSVTGKISLRSYGSASYAGLLSYIYADLKHDDDRVTAVMEWLKTNYTIEENPGMGPQGLYYYLHLMTKALTIYDAKELQLKDGKSVEWRHAVALKLINLQKPDGSWINDNGRWLEKDQALVTAYSIIALELIYRGM